MSARRPSPGRHSRPFVKLPHLEDLDLSNRELAIYVRLLWLLDDEVWRREGISGIAPIREGTLRQLAGTTRLDHAERWLIGVLSRFPGARWIPIEGGEHGLLNAMMEVGKLLSGADAARAVHTRAKNAGPQIKGFIFLPNSADSLEVAPQTRPDTDSDKTTTRQDADEKQNRSDTHHESRRGSSSPQMSVVHHHDERGNLGSGSSRVPTQVVAPSIRGGPSGYSKVHPEWNEDLSPMELQGAEEIECRERDEVTLREKAGLPRSAVDF